MEAIKNSELTTRYSAFKAANPKVRIRDAARQLNVSEMELLCASPDIKVTQLHDKWGDMLLDFRKLGRVMALTRNDSVVHERKGVYNNAEVSKGHARIGLVLDEEIDLRVFLSNWYYGFAVLEQLDDGERRSLQFFDSAGVAVHKIYQTEYSDVAAFDQFIEHYAKASIDSDFALKEMSDGRFNHPDMEVDLAAFTRAWDAMTDTHQFFGMLKKHKVDRMQALRLAGKARAYRLAPQEVENMLRHASASQMDIMVFVGNHGMVQIHTGRVNNIKVMGDWLNVMDPEFNLHIRTPDLANVWLVKKPTEDGQVTAVECYDQHENLVLQFFGKRKPGIPEAMDWREYVEALEAIQ